MSTSSGHKYDRIPINQITIGESNVRSLDDAKVGLDGLKKSIREVGLLQPIVVVEIGENLYDLVIGERRFLAVTELNKEHVEGFDKIDARIYPKGTELTDAKVYSAVENLQRRELQQKDKEKATTFLLKQLGNINDVAEKLTASVLQVSSWLDYDAIVPKSIKRYVGVHISREYAKQIVGATYPNTKLAEQMIKELVSRGYAKNALVRQKLLMELRSRKLTSPKKALDKAVKRAKEVAVRFILAGYYGVYIKKASNERLGVVSKQAINETAQSVVQDWIDVRYGKK
jgi:ParB family chromosome partitioning protein